MFVWAEIPGSSEKEIERCKGKIDKLSLTCRVSELKPLEKERQRGKQPDFSAKSISTKAIVFPVLARSLTLPVVLWLLH